jgi:hypothetical protein
MTQMDSTHLPTHLDFAWKTHEYINNYIRFADTKAAFVVAWTSGLLAVLYGANAHHIFVFGLDFSTAAVAPTLSLAAFLLLPAAFLIAVWSMIPRLPTTQRSGLVFWESILVHTNGELYARDLARRDEDSLSQHLCVQIHTVAGVAKTKYLYVSISMWLAFFGSICAVVVLMLKP